MPIVVNLGAKGTLLHNVSTGTGHWIEVKLVGTKSNRDGIGARVEVMAGGKRWTAERVASPAISRRTMGGCTSARARRARSTSCIVRWPSGIVQTLEAQPVDRMLTVEEPERGSRDDAHSRPEPYAAQSGCGSLRSGHGAFLHDVLECSEQSSGCHLPETEHELDYASPLELLFSPDGARLYVLCNESDEVRVLDAATYAPVKSIAVGHAAARIFTFAGRRRGCTSPTPGTIRSR